jgi:D-glycerate 3-kinase
MTDEQVKDFVDRFLPAYEAYLPGAAERGPPGSKKGRVLVIGVEDDRSLSREQPGPPRGL